MVSKWSSRSDPELCSALSPLEVGDIAHPAWSAGVYKRWKGKRWVSDKKVCKSWSTEM